MKTQARVQSLESGQALQFPRRWSGPVVLTQGELLLQEPARWLAGTFVQPRPVRFAAPAVLPATPHHAVVAQRASTVVLQEPEPLLSAADLLAAAVRLRARLRHWRPSFSA